jgi:hypothetical protein
MSEAVLAALNQITNTNAFVQAQRSVQDQFQDDKLFRLAYAKQTRLNALRAALSGRHIQTVWISNNIRLLADAPWQGTVRALEKDFFLDNNEASIQEKCGRLKQSIVIVNNNDAHQNGNVDHFGKWIARCPDTVFVAWDWDNHHWLSLSYPFAALSDVYCPSHYENMYPLSRFNAAMMVTPCGVVQWTKTFLSEKQAAILSAPRTDTLLGKHIYYGGFGYRNQVIATIEPKYPDVRFTTHQFHELTPEEKFAEWTSFKLHLIVPVLNDVPIRMFDAWATGGIPLVPESLRFSSVFCDVDPRDVVFYSTADVISPEAVVAKGCGLFDAGGHEGMMRRHHYGITRHHGEQRLTQMLDAAQRLIGLVWP